MSDGRKREIERAVASLPALRRWELVPEAIFWSLSRGPRLVLARRVLDFVEAGDRVLVIGLGHGYLTGLLMRDSPLAYLCGVDEQERCIESTKQMASVNGLQERDHRLEVRELLDIADTFFYEHHPSLILLVDALTGLDDPALALHSLAASMEEGTALVFDVPLRGDWEGPWGRARVTQLCAEAGLTIHHAQPVHAAWMLILVSRRITTPPRVLSAIDRSAGQAED